MSGQATHIKSMVYRHVWRMGSKLPVVSEAEFNRLRKDVRDAIAADQQIKHPFKWSNAELVHWLTTVAEGHFAGFAAGLGTSVDGQQLKKWPPLRFKQVRLGQASSGALFFTLLHFCYFCLWLLSSFPPSYA